MTLNTTIPQSSGLTRGIRNNNPGNVRLSQTRWNGEVFPGSDTSFCQFHSMDYGVRCTAVILLDYYHVHGLNTIDAIISRWAPTNENNTRAYIASVCALSGFSAIQSLDIGSTAVLTALCKAIFHVENGEAGTAVSAATGVTMALQEYAS